ncbi:MAG: hypothetical protein IPG22_07395 [Acidobacteria bacterium]|nr:hypothetical protein [Acidobacteriota bacterium]
MSLELALQENTAAVLQLVAALKSAGSPKAEKVALGKSKEAPAQTAATEPADTPTTAEQVAAPEVKASTSGEQSPSPAKKEPMTAEQRAPILTAAVAKAGRDAVVALLKSYGAARASEIAPERLAAFDVELSRMVA